MRSTLVQIFLILACGLAVVPAYGQGPLGAGPKKARTPDDYTPRTLKEVAAKVSDDQSGDEGDKIIVRGDILPSRVRVVYAGRTRKLPQIKKDVLNRWAQRYAGAPTHYTVHYKTELLFKEQGVSYWLAVRTQALAQIREELKKGQAVDLFLIRLGGAGAGDEWDSLLLVESFQKSK